MSYIIGEEYWRLEPETHCFSAKDWHGKYKLDCFKMFGFSCSLCGVNIGLSDGVVHHKTYKHKGGIYQARPHDIKDKICLMCHNCHEKEHRAISIDGITSILQAEEEIKYCSGCGCGFEVTDNALSNSKCDVCMDAFNKTMSEYIF